LLAALRQTLLGLGYRDRYNCASLFNENPYDAEMWAEAMEAEFEGKRIPFTRAGWDQLLGHCMVSLLVRNHGLYEACLIARTKPRPRADHNGHARTVFYRELLEAYPEAKVALTVRDSAE
jgi:hypothetical protein